MFFLPTYIQYYSLPKKRLITKGAMSLFIQKIILLCALILLSLHNIHGIHVNIHNSLEGSLDLIVHCKTMDDDFGVHPLHPGDNYGFSFNEKVLFDSPCSFGWNGETHSFNIYHASNLRKSNCDDCNWNIFKSGPCRIQQHGDPICFPFDN
ncbi:putative plant self-incompatibility S1 [Medicago truncatula]|uniref:S-protein homolog n=2 Tax=Medicago truncatula TaxID=3880 RepID=A0A396IB17_MEDTR|nr:putative plant self-incompatibility S1 [Medicago truncatula]